jgi:predicted GNAT superfamily acetyltransferase
MALRFYEAIRAALAEARAKVVVTVNSAMVGVYHDIGRQITEAVGERAEYGRNLLSFLSERLTAEFGKGFTVRNLQQMRQFYAIFPKAHALRAELSWTHSGGLCCFRLSCTGISHW